MTGQNIRTEAESVKSDSGISLAQAAENSRDPQALALSEATIAYIAKQDAALNKRAGWEQDALARIVHDLRAHGRVEVGWRESCGTTDPTHFIYRAWQKVLPKLKKDGLAFTEEPVKHKNGWATKGGGFWNSIIYTLVSA